MKISKLFHWLYALVMLLPIFAIGVTCGYAMFNKNAYQTSNEEFSTNFTVINSSQEITNGFDYLVKSNGNGYSQYQGFTNISLELPNDDNNYNQWQLSFNRIIVSDSVSGAYVYFNNWNTELTEFTYTSNGNVGTWQTEGLNIYGIQYRKSNFLNNIFYYSIDKVQQNPLFNWAYDSFLVTPFSYIANVFSLQTNSVIVMLLSYWLAISVIWLVFDVIMYVPLLVHRWMDKGVIE